MKTLRFIASVSIFYVFHMVIALPLAMFSSAPFIFRADSMYLIDEVWKLIPPLVFPGLLLIQKMTTNRCSSENSAPAWNGADHDHEKKVFVSRPHNNRRARPALAMFGV
jgi:hypothetical protein